MKIIKNELGYYPLYEVDDLDDFDKNANIKDFKEINIKKLCLVDEMYNLFIIELNKRDKIYEYKEKRDNFLIIAKNKYYVSNWNGRFMKVMETSADEYEIEMLSKIRDNNVINFTTKF